MTVNSTTLVTEPVSEGNGKLLDAPLASGSTATLSLTDKKLVCVEYPGFVISVDNMLDSVGGEQALTKTYADSSKRLELRFRPKDPYCHPVCGNRYSSNNLLLRVCRRKRKGSSGEAHITMEILGLIGTTYKFQGMADFQYLAMHNEPDGSKVSLYDKVILRKPEKKEFFDLSVPLFLPPPLFSRLDGPVDYFYRPDSMHREGNMQSLLLNENLIGPNRARRPHNAIFVNFDEKSIPTEPLEAAKINWKKNSIHHSDIKAEEEMRKLFERRPIWSRNAVKANVDIHPEKLKLLLPYLAYYMLTGPWRSLWVRFGYDPRTNPEAKIYQVLDFRIRCGMKHGYGVNDMPVKAKRSAYHYCLPTTVNKAGERTEEGFLPDDITLTLLDNGPTESAYVFREGMLPPYRQMLYQLCDLDVEQIKGIIQRNDGKEEVCDERDGWCLPQTADDLRDIISSMITQVVRAKRPASSSPKLKPVRAGRKMEESDEDDEEEYDDEYKPSEGSENEMETEMLDYM
uniref:Transcription factor IIIC subunit 5 HTH domain-containing protein n=1 Tax=Electrophorus electricus TaxID=8005 RepID=A0A4W4E5G2_ELEEL